MRPEILAALPNVFRLMSAGQFETAEFQLGHLLIGDPRSIAVLSALAETHYMQRGLPQAIRYTHRAMDCLTQYTSLDEVLYLSKMLRCIGEPKGAVDVVNQYGAAVKLSSRGRAKLAMHWLNLDCIDEAIAVFATLDDSELSDFEMAMNATALLYSGEPVAARILLERALKRNPANAHAAHQLAMLRVTEGRRERIALLQEHVDRTLTPADRALFNFALFHELDAEGEIAPAFAALEAANQARSVHNRHDVSQESLLLDQYLKKLDAIELPKTQDFALSGSSPVFIVGLPRTGTTLLEKMLLGLGDVRDVGEHLGFRKSLELLCGTVFGNPFEIGSHLLSTIDFDMLGTAYRKKSEWLAKGSHYYTDKEPFNYTYCGLIAKALPDARILHIQRNPMDSCFSIFKQSFAHGSFTASYRWDDLVAHYHHYSRIMDYWRQRLGERLLEIRYEDMVLRPDKTLIEISTYTQFEPPDGLRGPMKLRASTLSAAQVQQPIHARNINAWAKYADFLKPLREQLDDAYVAYMSAIEGVEIL